MHKMDFLKMDLFAQSGGFGGWIMATVTEQGSFEHALGILMMLFAVINGGFMIWKNFFPKKK